LSGCGSSLRAPDRRRRRRPARPGRRDGRHVDRRAGGADARPRLGGHRGPERARPEHGGLSAGDADRDEGAAAAAGHRPRRPALRCRHRPRARWGGDDRLRALPVPGSLPPGAHDADRRDRGPDRRLGRHRRLGERADRLGQPPRLRPPIRHGLTARLHPSPRRRRPGEIRPAARRAGARVRRDNHLSRDHGRHAARARAARHHPGRERALRSASAGRARCASSMSPIAPAAA
jgi:hypothetical protein